MPGRKRVGRPRKTTRHVQQGAGFMDFLRKAGNFIKDKKIISTGLGMLAGATGNPLASTGANVASQLGLGKRRRRRAPARRAPARAMAGGAYSNIVGASVIRR